jgi:cytochrome c5
MVRFLILVIAVAAGCAQQDGNASTTPAQGMLPGQQAYENVCATCHAQGLNGAPAIGDREAWADRSELWVAVLEEHAKEGYLAMPARGGDPTLSDQEVSAAAEYMLTQTLPERRPE